MDKDEPLTLEILRDPKHPVPKTLLYVYSLENSCYVELNRASRFKDHSKLKTLGPWAMALNQIIYKAQENRTDVTKYDCTEQQDMWRGGGMTAPEVKEIQQLVGKKEIDPRWKEYDGSEIE